MSGMLIRMVQRWFLWVLPCAVLCGCSGVGEPEGIDVTPLLSGSGTQSALAPLPAERFDGASTRIGFEPIPLEGGEFQTLTDFVFLPESDEILALSRTGKVGRFRLEGTRASLIDAFQIPAVFTGGSCGAMSLTLDPAFVTNRLFYVGYCLDAQYSVVKRYTMDATDFGQTLYSAANILAAGDPKADQPQHVIGTIAFGPDAVLWATLGDHQRDLNAQTLTNDLGKVIRFAPQTQDTVNGYTIPEGNAFPDQSPKSPLVYAYGLRNPWRGVFDAAGRFWVADVGSSLYEEINVITSPGQNFGWPLAEGPVCTGGSCATLTLPVRLWEASSMHPFLLDDPLAKTASRFHAAWVGIEYQPVLHDRYQGLLTGAMLYGDFYAGFVRAVRIDARARVVSDIPVGHIELPVAWRQGSDDYLYVGTMYASLDHAREKEGDATLLPQTAQGQLWRVVPLP